MLVLSCAPTYDRVYPLDYWICILGFVFDLNFKETLMVVKEKNYINILIDRFNYSNEKTKEQMEIIRSIINDYIDMKLYDQSNL